MGRPRQYDLDDLLAHARDLWVGRGVDGLTIRALSAASGASNGAVYHAFGSRDGLLARVWAEEAGRFLTFQRDRVAEATREGDATEDYRKLPAGDGPAPAPKPRNPDGGVAGNGPHQEQGGMRS